MQPIGCGSPFHPLNRSPCHPAHRVIPPHFHAAMRAPLLAPALFLLAACASRGAGGYDPNAVRMCVENNTVGYGNVVAYANSVRFTVYPGEEVCKQVSVPGPGLTIRGGTTSGGGAGPLRFGFTLPASSTCWHWRVSSAPTIDVVSCDTAVGY